MNFWATQNKFPVNDTITIRLAVILILLAAFGGAAFSQSAAVSGISDHKEGKYFTHRDGVKTFYKVFGKQTGTPLFVLHGGPGFDHQYFLSNSAFKEIAKKRPVILYDQRGSGKSSKLDAHQTAQVIDLVNDLGELKHHLGYEKIAVAGHSWGGFLAMAFAVVAPEETSHLILIDAPPPLFLDTSDYIKLRIKYPEEYSEMNRRETEYRKTGERKDLRASLVAYMKMLFYSPKKRDAFIAGSENYTYDLDTAETIGASAMQLNFETLLPKLNIPTLLIHGRHDVNLTLESTTVKIARAIPKAKIIIFEKSGHLPFYEEKKKFVKAMNKFLGS